MSHIASLDAWERSTPHGSRTAGMKPEHIAELARTLDCEIHEVDERLERRAKFYSWLDERIEYVGGRENL